MPNPAIEQAPLLTDYPDLADLYDHWVGRFGGAPIPAWSAFDPVEMRRWLGRLNLVEVAADGSGARDFVYRVFATDIADRLDREMTGLSVGEGAQGLREELIGDYEEVVDTANPILRRHESSNRSRLLPHVRLMLPLGDGDCEVTRVLVGMHPMWQPVHSSLVAMHPSAIDAQAIFGAHRLRTAAH